jgi:hypothetical protein
VYRKNLLSIKSLASIILSTEPRSRLFQVLSREDDGEAFSAIGDGSVWSVALWRFIDIRVMAS